MRPSSSAGSPTTTSPTLPLPTARTWPSLSKTTGRTMSSSLTTTGTLPSFRTTCPLPARRSRKVPRRTRTASSPRCRMPGTRLPSRPTRLTATLRAGSSTRKSSLYCHHSSQTIRTDLPQLDRISAQGIPRLPQHSQPEPPHSRLAPPHCPLQLPVCGKQGRRDRFLPR